MTLEVIGKTARNNLPLGNRFARVSETRQFGINGRLDERIMSATEQQGINHRIAGKEFLQVLADEVLSSVGVVFAGFDEWHPHRAGLLGYNKRSTING